MEKSKQELFRYTGNLQQLIYARPVRYQEGRSEGMNAYEVKCGDITFHAMADKCLDVSDLSYKGMNMTFLSKPGLIGRNAWDTAGGEAQRSIMCGLFFTCGFENICAPCNIDGRDYPMHGRMRTSPAEHCSADVIVREDGIKAVLSAEIREAELFGENMVLRRRVESELGTNSILVTDEIENQTFRPEPLILMYHCNMGYPFLDENCEIFLPTTEVRGREEFSEQHKDKWNIMEPPEDNAREYVFYHRLKADSDLNTLALMVNNKYSVGLLIEFNKKNLPWFVEWKSIVSGDYVVGLEPANVTPYNREYHLKNGNLHKLGPFEKETNTLRFTVLDGTEEIEKAKKRIQELK
ncbi:MAG: aldose 1-epimerase family protein [Lachnospiraceae bacterium]|nr:aldose 1-epimerase family protein [Lachnospiraceae bacterium]